VGLGLDSRLLCLGSASRKVDGKSLGGGLMKRTAELCWMD